MKQVETILVYNGRAKEAMNFYCNVFDDSEILELHEYGPQDTGETGTIKQALLRIRDAEFLCTDRPVHKESSHTPSVSIGINASTEQEIQELYDALSEYGIVMMPLDDYGIGKLFAWVADRFGVSWQLKLG